MPYDNEEKIKQNHDLAERDEPNGTMHLKHGPDSRIHKAHFEILHTRAARTEWRRKVSNKTKNN